MNRIDATMQALAATGRKAFVAYITAGDPDLERSEAIIAALAEAGVDIIELGFPYSDPMADGPVIQAAGERALAAGTTVPGILAMVARLRRRTQVPLLAFTYINPLLRYGVERFVSDAAAAGLDGILPLDLPPEQDRGLASAATAAGLALVRLVAPNTVPARRRTLARSSSGFIYYVCRYGVTGERSALPEDLAEQVADLRRHAGGVPVCIGFGIASPQQAAAAAAIGDGAVVGSHLVQLVAEHRQDPQVAAIVADRAAALAAAVHEVAR